ncbi:MAG: hypothetical protein ACI9R3_003595 [Verrucomicrobiales bacterium]|jgi:hypothetical protein
MKNQNRLPPVISLPEERRIRPWKLSCVASCSTLLLVLLFADRSLAREQLIGPDSVWHYYDSSTPSADDWMKSEFDAKGWKSGQGAFGAQFPGTKTSIAAGEAKVPTTYFRTTFNAVNAQGWGGFDGWIRASDGYIVYLDGTPYRSGGVEKMDSSSPGNVYFDPGDGFRRFTIPIGGGGSLAPGDHTVAVAIFQSTFAPARMHFDMQLFAYEKERETVESFPLKTDWKYHEGEAPSASWKLLDFDDSTWKTGTAPLGYGDTDIATELESGSNNNTARPVTTWLRKEFQLTDKTKSPVVGEVAIMSDDGAVIYVNGFEVGRDNMPAGTIIDSTLAVESKNGPWERYLRRFPVDADYLRPGRNVVAVEVHQIKATSTDLRMDLQLSVDFLPGNWHWNAASALVADKDGQGNASSSSKIVNVNDSAAIKAAGSGAWRATSEAMQKSAIKAYEAAQLEQAARRYAAGRWAVEFSKDARILDPELKQYLLSTEATALSLEYFDLLSPRDKTKKVYAILNGIYSSSAESFKAYPGLALAISIVYDQSPPRNWPHHQVSQSLLPRKLPDPIGAFQFWTKTDERGKTLHSLNKLQLEELKYVVDVPVSLAELEKALGERARLTSMSDLYSGIKYDTNRFRTGVYDWPHTSYALGEIKKLGGICVDQAYFTTTVAKAHGVPSMLVSGAGQDGNHAWVGFLDKKSWDFETGRYPESKFVTGTMFDPQTWEQPTDHEIAFLSERFRGSSKYQISRVHARFAREFLNSSAIPQAEKAAKAAILSEDRNLGAWETLLSCLDARKASNTEKETVLTDAAKAFSRYADMESQFLEKLAASYASQGNTREADKLRARIIRRNSEDRPDLALAQAKSELDELIKSSSVKDQLDHYKRVINRLDEAGLIAYYALTQPFLNHLQSKGETDTARDALKHTKRRLKASGEGQLGEALDGWEARLSG